MSNDNKLLVWLVVICLVLSFFGLWGAWTDKGVDKDEVKEIVATEIAKIPEPVIPEVPTAEEIAALVVVPEPDFEKLKSPLLSEEKGNCLVLWDAPRVDLSSTAVREKLQRGESAAGLIGENVLQYIRENKLYSK